MKLIIAGGRNYRLTGKDVDELDRIPISEVVSGGATGADASGESYAHSNMLPVRRFKADWRKHGKGAGPIRNRQMAEYADAVALFPGGRGTESMRNEAIKAGIEIYDFRSKPSEESKCLTCAMNLKNEGCSECVAENDLETHLGYPHAEECDYYAALLGKE